MSVCVVRLYATSPRGMSETVAKVIKQMKFLFPHTHSSSDNVRVATNERTLNRQTNKRRVQIKFDSVATVVCYSMRM